MSTVVASRHIDSGIFEAGYGSELVVPWTSETLLPPPNTPIVKPLRLNTAMCMTDQVDVEAIDINKTHVGGAGAGVNATKASRTTTDVEVELGSEDEDDDAEDGTCGFLTHSPPPPNSPDLKYLSDPFAQADALDAKRKEELADIVPLSSPVREYFVDDEAEDDYFSCPPKPVAVPSWDPESPTVVRSPAASTTVPGGPTVRFALNLAGTTPGRNGRNNVESSTYAINQFIKRKVVPDNETLTRAWSAPSLTTKLAQAKAEEQEKTDEEPLDDGSEAVLEKERFVPPKGASLAGLDSSALTLALLKAEYGLALAREDREVTRKHTRNISAEVSATLRRSYTSPPGQWTMGKPDDNNSSHDGSDTEDDEDDNETVASEHQDANV